MKEKQNKKTKFFIILAIIFVEFTVIAFAVPFARTVPFWLSYGFGLLAIIAQFNTRTMALSEDLTRSKYYHVPIVHISSKYLILQLALSLVFMTIGKLIPIWIPAVLFPLLFLSAAVGFVPVNMKQRKA